MVFFCSFARLLSLLAARPTPRLAQSGDAAKWRVSHLAHPRYQTSEAGLRLGVRLSSPGP